VTNHPEPEDWIQHIDATLQEWRQGDFVLGEQWFVQRYHPQHPLTQDSQEAITENGDLVEYSVRGLVVVTQTCDIVRTSSYPDNRPFVEVVPLVEVDQENLVQIQKGQRPQYAFIPGAKHQNLVADLDRVMTLEKAVVASWERQTGCETDQQIRDLGLALARKRQRFAFPDDFISLVRKLTNRLKDKHDKNSEEGKALRALQEIRIRATPSWSSLQIELMFWFIRDEHQIQFENKNWSDWMESWLNLVPPSDRFLQPEGQVVTLEDLTAKDYLESDRLDLDQLSLPMD